MPTIYADQDSYTRESSPDSNYGSSTFLVIRVGTGIIDRTFIEFDITPYAVAGISQAILWIYISSGSQTPRTWKFERITSSWDESVITWNTGVPTVTATNSTTEGISFTGTGYWESINITNMLKDETGNSFGVRIIDNDESESTEYWNAFPSSEDASNNPYLVLTTNDKYVDISTGSDADDGNTWVNAYLTVKKGIDNISSPATLHIAEGDYSAQAAIDLNKNLEILCEDYGGGNASPPLTVVLPVTT